MCVNNLPKVTTKWNSSTTRDSNRGRRVLIPSALTTTPLSHVFSLSVLRRQNTDWKKPILAKKITAICDSRLDSKSCSIWANLWHLRLAREVFSLSHVCLYSPKKQKVKNAVKPIARRPARKQLQSENTDAVWTELTFLQQENKTLKADKYRFVFLSKTVVGVRPCMPGCVCEKQLLIWFPCSKFQCGAG